ncbi:hypothetical protein [Nocardioides bizhenqiangii]|uniref:Uncharacterized protein n=1 Tax=Nocardioides bizhenqiangii TaxID=3095076 RepID=A0ABZ0ZLC9_9ACTN|nr:hypothetical protein [Nocardioides sp. HM61]WQQ25122.1 hypothetical protein SHK19_14245 [Nocardioides sp. HM61]
MKSLVACFAMLLVGCSSGGASGGPRDAADTDATTPAAATQDSSEPDSATPVSDQLSRDLLRLRPTATRRWPVSRPASCRRFDAVEHRRSVILVPQIDLSCVQALRLDSVAIVIAPRDRLPRGRLDGTLTVRDSRARLFRIVERANAFQVAIVRIEDPRSTMVIMRGSGSNGPSIEELVNSLP